MTSREFWESLQFNSLTTYSFHRGEALVAYLATLESQIAQLQTELRTARFMRQIAIQKHLAQLEKAQYVHNKGLLDTGQLHPTAQAIQTLSVTDAETKALGAILTLPIREQVALGCPPTYRDAIVFYDAHGQIVSLLNVCLQCVYLANKDKISLQADFAVFGQLYYWFQRLGHQVEIE